MNKSDIINIVEEYKLDKNNFVILSGAALVVMGIKDKTFDIDISVTKEYYNYLIDHYKCTLDCIDKNGNKVYYIDNIINFGLLYWTDNINVINDIKVQSLDEIIKLKKLLNREKDLKDLQLIKKYKNLKD